MPKSVLIICWDFLQPGAIGGRRWSKIAKSMVRKNILVSVLAVPSKDNAKSWISQDYVKKMHLYYIRPNRLSRWLVDYNSFWKSIKIRVAQLFLHLLHKGTIFDKAALIERKFLKKVIAIVRDENVDFVIVTGAPFSLMYYTAKLKMTFPNLKIMADYRDPWTTAVNYGMKSLNIKNKRAEEERQNFVLENVDFVSAPNMFLLKEVASCYTGKSMHKPQFFELPHAYDPDDYLTIKPYQRVYKRIIYAGTLYMHSESFLDRLYQAIYYYNQQVDVPELKIDFFTNDKLISSRIQKVVNCKRAIGDEVFAEIVNCDMVILLLSEHNKNYLTSKFYEFLPYNKPYLYVGPEGFVSEKIEKENLGIVLREPNDLYNYLKSINISTCNYIGRSNYTFDNLTKELLNAIE